MLHLKTPPLRVDALAWYPDSPGLRKAFTFVPPHMDEDEEAHPFPMYRVSEGEGLIGLPREVCPPPTPETDKRARGHNIYDPAFTIKPKLKLTFRSPEQEKVFNDSLNRLKTSQSHIVKATTGFGKTALGCYVMAMLGVPTLIVVQKEDLMEQWRASLMKFCGLKAHEIGLIQQDVCSYGGFPVVLSMVHSLVKEGKYPDHIRDYFGLVIFDEVHRMAAETFNRSCFMFSALYRLGLSATVDRPDGKDPVFKAHIGGVRVETTLVQMPPKVVLVPTKFRLPIVARWVEGEARKVVLPHSPARMMGVVKSMSGNLLRNQQIATMAYSSWVKGRNTLVFAHGLDHLETLFHMTAKKGVPTDDMAYYVGTGPHAKEQQRDRSRHVAKIVWGTYRMVSEGTDIPRLDCAILATPQAHILQPVGRVLREHPGKKQPVIFDLVDGESGSGILNGFARSRRKEYHSLGGTVLQL